jgi:tagatose-6-phosphate ketose/aldose isomerase
MISIARSGESPESAGAVTAILEQAPDVKHLVITANSNSRLAREFSADGRVSAVVLADATCDRSLVMTSSFTNLALAAFGIGENGAYLSSVDRLANATEVLLANEMEALARVAGSGFRRAVYLGSGANFGAAREGALKMLEMTAGRVGTIAETYLGFRHGPMSYVDAQTLVVCFLSADPVVRAYEVDLVSEINRKQLGAFKLFAGPVVPHELVSAGDTVLEERILAGVDDGYSAVRNVVIAQLLGFFRCRAEGLRPDSPSNEGIINRVVESFTLHQNDGKQKD